MKPRDTPHCESCERLTHENDQLRDAVTIWQKLADERKEQIRAQSERLCSLSKTRESEDERILELERELNAWKVGAHAEQDRAIRCEEVRASNSYWQPGAPILELVRRLQRACDNRVNLAPESTVTVGAVELLLLLGHVDHCAKNAAPQEKGRIDDSTTALPVASPAVAAPDLLAALELARQWMVHRAHEDDLAFVDAAIKKARGQ